MKKKIDAIRSSVLFKFMVFKLFGLFIPFKHKLRVCRFTVREIYDGYVKGNVIEKQHVADSLDFDQFELFARKVNSAAEVFCLSHAESLRMHQLKRMLDDNSLQRMMEARHGNKNVIQRIN
jgi:hypothetical protein